MVFFLHNVQVPRDICDGHIFIKLTINHDGRMEEGLQVMGKGLGSPRKGWVDFRFFLVPPFCGITSELSQFFKAQRKC